jgi:hypothetical protein
VGLRIRHIGTDRFENLESCLEVVSPAIEPSDVEHDERGYPGALSQTREDGLRLLVVFLFQKLVGTL